MGTWRKLGIAALSLGVAASLAACGSGGASGASGGEDVEGSGTLDGGGETLVVFMPSTSNSYLAAGLDSIKAEAEELNFTVKSFENDFDQTEEDQQVQEWLATGEDAAAILYWPAAGEAATNSIRQLSKKAPVFQFNQAVQDDAQEFVTAYAGVSDYGIGEQAGKSALEALAERQDAGVEFHGPDGKPNLIEFRFPTGYVAGDERHDSFVETTDGAFNELTVEPLKAPDAQSGYEAASQIIPKFKADGIDFIYAQNNNSATGVVQALEQNGLVAGEDVIVVAGDYSGDKQPLRDGKIHSAVVQSPVIEGALIVRTAAQYLATGEVTDETVTIPDDAEKPEAEIAAPAKVTYIMNPPVTADTYDSFKIWGMGIDELVK
ncbi:sugar ABC transporter substrate-binding protein [Leucobacter allii]|uniref:sugar ABC transporter substrate-binding protein n=1 Tax=Leucobacter allii TaxID=2932247 RepID=UPI001FD607B9|nr:sugar ABC transporter substrate-binding protein [Leucobacter allii]UOR01333.1 sugar ABC transporter substrate-binding protein [Leucobacter allii]